MNKFWLHFTSGYGVIWLTLVLIAIVTSTHIDTGEFGLYGFPIIALIYGLIRNRLKTSMEVDYDRLKRENARLKHQISMYENADKND